MYKENKRIGKKDNKITSTQLYLRISEIRDNIVVLKDGGIRGIIKTTSINFNLKSEDEQNAIIYSYQNFLNSLDFPIQILVKSKKLDLNEYINQVKELGDKQQNKLLQEQTYEYAQYISKLIDYADIMEKNFYVIVPYTIGMVSGKNDTFQNFFKRVNPKEKASDIIKRDKNFDKHKKQIIHRLTIVKNGLNNCGLQTEDLNTEKIIELLYQCHNPLSSQSSKLNNIDTL